MVCLPLSLKSYNPCVPSHLLARAETQAGSLGRPEGGALLSRNLEHPTLIPSCQHHFQGGLDVLTKGFLSHLCTGVYAAQSALTVVGSCSAVGWIKTFKNEIKRSLKAEVGPRKSLCPRLGELFSMPGSCTCPVLPLARCFQRFPSQLAAED